MNELIPGEQEPELRRLVDGLLDDTLSPGDRERLEERLRRDKSAVDYCAERLRFHVELEEACDPVRLELSQHRHLLIEGRGEGRRVVIGETHVARLGNRHSEMVLPLEQSESKRSARRGPALGIALAVGFAAVIALLLLKPWEHARTIVMQSGGPDGPLWVRKPSGPDEMRFWMRNMVWNHHYSIEEIEAATGMAGDEIRSTLSSLEIFEANAPERWSGLRIAPYPGGRHPRTGYKAAAINPQRETKVSVFAPWDRRSYAVVDLPEALHDPGGYYYLAHTDVPTVWTKMNVHLKPLEWTRDPDGSLSYRRELPNKLAFGAKVRVEDEAVRMSLSVTNGTLEKISKLRGQVCVLLARLDGFNGQTNANKVTKNGYVACHDESRKRWIITAWEPTDRFNAIQHCPCMHADPGFPDIAPGETVSVTGWLSFFEGEDLDAELARIEETGWRGTSN
ncbi:hypothetical protein HAHE_18950 [Haloferula helveola]|uniref:Uncharacterized protein n=1 Tax=Haloferula helveola TaxID=490095 RepID=A0ABM7RFS1_9BACT|nr:hypothetical protein HAHE_18950 [Haloferula helveola]